MTDALASLSARHISRIRARDREDGVPVMTADRLKIACLENDGFETPELNDKLYLHFCGFRRIENLEPYTALRALWLESNGLRAIEGLSHLLDLRCLYLQQNAIAKIEGLSSLTNLVTLNLSNNCISHVEGLSALPRLSTLNLAHNSLATPEAIAHLMECRTLTNVDLSDNLLPGGDDAEVVSAAIADVVARSPVPALAAGDASAAAATATAAPPPAAAAAAPPPPAPGAAAAEAPALDSDDEGEAHEAVVEAAPAVAPAPAPVVDPAAVAAAVAAVVADDARQLTVLTILARMPALSAVYLKGNPLCRSTRNYRKVVLTMLPGLTYLDDRPIFEVERVGTDAWAQGGRDAEAAARQSFEAEQKAKERDNVERFKSWQADIRARRASELEALNAERAQRGEAPLTELPRKSFVSYGRVSAKHHDEHIRLRRLMDRAEAAARTNGFHGTAMMDLGREHWTEEAARMGVNLAEVVGEEGAGEADAAATPAAPASGKVIAVPVVDAQGNTIGVRYIDEATGRPVTEATDVYDDEIEAAAAAVQAPLPPGAKIEGASGASPQPTPAAATTTASTAQQQAGEDEDDEDDDDEVKPWQPAPRAAPENDPLQLVQQSLKLFNIRLTKEAADSTQQQAADREAEPAPAPVATALPAKAAAPEPAAPAPAPPSLWTRSLDAALLKFVPQASFDFGKVAKALRNGVSRGVLSLGLPTTDPLEDVLSEVACRERFAELSLSSAPAAAAAPAPATATRAAPADTAAVPPPVPEAPALTPVPTRPVKPLSQLVRGEFRLPEDAEGHSAVALPVALPSLASNGSGAAPSVAPKQPRAAAPASDDEEEGGDIVPLSREALLASLGSQYRTLPQANPAVNTDVDGLD